MMIVAVVCAALLLARGAHAHAHEGLRGSVSFLNDRVFTASWTLNATSNTLRVTVRAQTAGWFAIGFNDEKKMAKAGAPRAHSGRLATSL